MFYHHLIQSMIVHGGREFGGCRCTARFIIGWYVMLGGLSRSLRIMCHIMGAAPDLTDLPSSISNTHPLNVLPPPYTEHAIESIRSWRAGIWWLQMYCEIHYRMVCHVGGLELLSMETHNHISPWADRGRKAVRGVNPRDCFQ
jgi:hypothetical protein